MFLFILNAAFSFLAACFASRLSHRYQKKLLSILALLFPLSEIGKQVLLYQYNNGSYDWWYFPFQLCSMPLYLLPLYCLLPSKYEKGRLVLAAFLVDFGLLGGLFAFADQSGMHYALPVLTLHSYAWHDLMIFLGLFLALTGKSSFRPRDFLPPCALFLLLAATATGLNLIFHTRGLINMFYISPYFPMEQVVFKSIALRIGQAAGRWLYLGMMVAGAFLIHLCGWLFFSHFKTNDK